MFKQSFFYYVLGALIFLTFNAPVIHYQRMGYLRHLFEVPGKGQDKAAALRYYDYLRRLNLADEKMLQFLAIETK